MTPVGMLQYPSVGIANFLSFMLEAIKALLYVMNKLLAGELSCMQTGLVFLDLLLFPW